MKKIILILFLITSFVQSCNIINDNKTGILNASASIKLSKESGVFDKEFSLVDFPTKGNHNLYVIEAWSEKLWMYSNQEGNINTMNDIQLIVRFSDNIINDSISFTSTNKNLGKQNDKLLIPLNDNENSVSFYLNTNKDSLLFVLKEKE